MTETVRRISQLMPRDRTWQPPALTPVYRSTALRSPRQALISLGTTPADLSGPVFGHSMLGPVDDDLIRNFSRTGEEAMGQRLILHGRVFDENARPVPNTLVEFWQANAAGGIVKGNRLEPVRLVA